MQKRMKLLADADDLPPLRVLPMSATPVEALGADLGMRYTLHHHQACAHDVVFKSIRFLHGMGPGSSSVSGVGAAAAATAAVAETETAAAAGEPGAVAAANAATAAAAVAAAVAGGFAPAGGDGERSDAGCPAKTATPAAAGGTAAEATAAAASDAASEAARDGPVADWEASAATAEPEGWRFPRTLFRQRYPLFICAVCGLNAAQYKCVGDRLADEDPLVLCEYCHYMLHYSTDGRLLYEDFELLPMLG
ncbi:unnamed protein product [Phaeothamnion confervicola]